jgi:hypothetical protein
MPNYLAKVSGPSLTSFRRWFSQQFSVGEGVEERVSNQQETGQSPFGVLPESRMTESWGWRLHYRSPGRKSPHGCETIGLSPHPLYARCQRNIAYPFSNVKSHLCLLLALNAAQTWQVTNSSKDAVSPKEAVSEKPTRLLSNRTVANAFLVTPIRR